MKTFYTILLMAILSLLSFSQKTLNSNFNNKPNPNIDTIYNPYDKCKLSKSVYNNIYRVNNNNLICLAKKSPKRKTLFYTFGIWCKPCILHLPNAINLAKEYNLDFYILLVDKEKSDKIKESMDYIVKEYKDINVIILEDESKGNSRRKYKNFLDKITPKSFENIDDMSKYIIIDNEGKVVMVTNWKDNRDHNWRDDSIMIKERIIPVLE